MNKNMAMLRKVGGLGLASAIIMGSAGVMAVDFTGSVTVQNNIAVENVADLTFGSLSVQAAAGGAADAAHFAAFELSPTGGTTLATSDDTEVAFVNLGGAAPAQGRVVTGSNFTLQFPADSWLDELDDISGGVTGGAASSDADALHVAVTAGNGITLQNSLSDPSIADFYLFNFRVGDVASVGNAFGTPAATKGPDDVSWNFTAPSGATEYTFAFGGTLVTDPLGDDSYEEVVYEGTFEVTANF